MMPPIRVAHAWALSHGTAWVLPATAAMAVLVLALNNKTILLPLTPNGTLIQTAIPIFAGLLAARLPYDALGTLATAGCRPLMIHRLCWLIISSAIILAPAAIHANAHHPGIWPVRALGPSLITIALALAASTLLSYRATSVAALLTGLALFFAARPALTGSTSWLAHCWRGDQPYIVPAATAALLLAILAGSITGPHLTQGEIID